MRKTVKDQETKKKEVMTVMKMTSPSVSKRVMTWQKINMILARPKKPVTQISHLLHVYTKEAQGKCLLPPRGKGPCQLHQLQGFKRQKCT